MITNPLFYQIHKLTVTLFFLLTLNLSYSQNENITVMKKKVYEMTEQIRKNESFSLTIFKNQMVSLILLKKAADAPELLMSEENRSIIKNVGRTRYAELLKEDHQSIITTAKKYNINWKKIKFVDFLYKTRAIFKLGQPGYEGLLIFKDKSQKDILFTIQVDFIILGTDPYIFEMDDLKRVKK